jgi:hypothetical protein
VQSAESIQAPSGPTLRERQLVGGRYRLAAFHRRDKSTEVWRALDESVQQVVTIEFLRDTDPVARDRFISEGKRMAAFERPSVMKVAQVNEDGADGTFIVYEHLVHVPVPLDWLKPVEDAAPAPVLAQPTPPVAPAPPVLPTPAPQVSAPPPPAFVMPSAPLAETAAAQPDVDDGPHADRGVNGLLFALRAREFSLIDVALVREAADELVALVREAVGDIQPSEVLDRIRAIVGRANPASLAGSIPRPSIGMPHVALPHRAPGAPKEHVVQAPKVKAERAPRVKEPKPVKIKNAPVAATPRAPRRGLHVRWGRVISRGFVLGVLASAIVVVPAEYAATVARELSSTVVRLAPEITSNITSNISRLIPSGSSTAPLARASFEVPPLAAYGAAFESQGPYPTAKAGSTVEWVVALRNTGSAGWYRGIDGAQASLVLADGSIAATQTTAYVGPGEVGWFVVHFPAPAQPGTYQIALLPRIDGRGPLADLGIFATVNVAAK